MNKGLIEAARKIVTAEQLLAFRWLEQFMTAQKELSTLESQDVIYEVVMPCSHPNHTEVRLRKKGNLRDILEQVQTIWNKKNPDYKRGTAESAYVFIVLGKVSIAIPGMDVAKLTSIRTQDYSEKNQTKWMVVKSTRKGWV